MSLSDRIFGILTNANTLRINFSFRGINGNNIFVLGADFLMVAQSMVANKIAIVEGTADPGEAIYTARDDANMNANTMYIGQNNYSSQSFEALVVHETVHAIYDLKRTVIPWIDNETAAYIAQGFYANNAGIPDNHVSAQEFIYLGKMISNNIIARQPIDNFWLDEMRDKLRNDPVYVPYIYQTFVGDG